MPVLVSNCLFQNFSSGTPNKHKIVTFLNYASKHWSFIYLKPWNFHIKNIILVFFQIQTPYFYLLRHFLRFSCDHKVTKRHHSFVDVLTMTVSTESSPVVAWRTEADGASGRDVASALGALVAAGGALAQGRAGHFVLQLVRVSRSQILTLLSIKMT
jgi:hypothetical protein